MLWAQMLRDKGLPPMVASAVKISEEAAASSGPIPARVSAGTSSSIPPSQRSQKGIITSSPSPAVTSSDKPAEDLATPTALSHDEQPQITTITLADFLRLRKVLATVLTELTGQLVELPIPEEIDLLLPGTSGAMKNLQQLLKYTQKGSTERQKRSSTPDLKNSFKAAYKQLSSPTRKTSRSSPNFSSSSYPK